MLDALRFVLYDITIIVDRRIKGGLLMKKIVSLLCVLVIVFSFSAVGLANYSAGNPFASARTGDIITFGSYEQDNNLYNGKEPIEWIVVETFPQCIKLVSRYALECMRFNAGLWATGWANSDVRRWLNNTFMSSAFTAEEQSMIDLARTPNRGNSAWGVESQGDTYDKIFLLDEKEVRTYFGDQSGYRRVCSPTLHAVANGGYINDYSRATWWWTRTPGKDLTHAVYVGNGGNLDYEGNPINWENGCVRPGLLVSTTRSMTVTPAPQASSVPSASDVIYCPQCGKQIPAGSRFCMYCGYQISASNSPAVPSSPPPVFYPTTPSSSKGYGPWSEWSTTPVYANANREVESRTVADGYYMVHYGTQQASEPHYRVFRDYSICGDYDQYHARYTYGEKHFTRYVSADMLNKARTYSPGTYVNGEYAGYQEGNQIAYYFGDDKYVWFIESAVMTTQYRWRSIY